MSELTTDVATDGTLWSETLDRQSEKWRELSELVFRLQMARAVELSKCHDLTHLAVAWSV